MWYRGEGLRGGREGGQGGGCCNEIQEEGGAGNTVGRDKVRLYQFKKKVEAGSLGQNRKADKKP